MTMCFMDCRKQLHKDRESHVEEEEKYDDEGGVGSVGCKCWKWKLRWKGHNDDNDEWAQ